MKISNYTIAITCLILATAIESRTQNLVPSDSWTVGSGSVGIFLVNGSASENVREIGSDPYGRQSVLWKAIPDAASGADGGWDGAFFSIDNTKMYRYSVWIKKTNSINGTTYFGCNGNDILTLAGSVNSNPYFWSGDLPQLDKWYLLVGYIHASNDPSTSNYGGIFDGDTGLKVANTTDFKFSSGATQARHRTYLYYDTNTSDRQYFYDPQVYALNGTLPLEETSLADFKNGEVYFNKNVGVGTSNPGFPLEISTNQTSTSPTLSASFPLSLVNRSLVTNSMVGIQFKPTDGLTAGAGSLGFQFTDPQNNRGRFFISTRGASGYLERLSVGEDGNVGIGTTSPDSKLTVKGNIHTQEVKVDLNGAVAPDYVFEKDYALTSLEELKAYIDQNKHLPEVPSAKEMEEDGVNLKEMNLLLLKKVEELTLYLLKQEQRIRTLESKNDNN